MRNLTPPSARPRMAARLRYWLSLSPTLVLALTGPVRAQPTGSVAARPSPCNTPASLIASQTTLCQGGSAVLTIDEGCGGPAVAYTNIWTPDHDISSTTGSQVVVNPLVTTTYQVTGTGTGGATRVFSITITVQDNCCQYSTRQRPPNVVELGTYYTYAYSQSQYGYGDPFKYDFATTPPTLRPPGTYFHFAGNVELNGNAYHPPVGSVLLMEPRADIILDDAQLFLEA